MMADINKKKIGNVLRKADESTERCDDQEAILRKSNPIS